MRLLLDMNLSPVWVTELGAQAHDVVHWSAVGDPRAPDAEILAWARAHDRIVVTHDLDFTAILASTSARSPSVLQIRTQDVTPDALGSLLADSLLRHEAALLAGALVVVEPARLRVRVLPLPTREIG
jgi:predicted nuclease of predicted toxin-antitoxin system